MKKLIANSTKKNDEDISMPTNINKYLERGAKILMYDGTYKNVEDISTGERVMDNDGTPRTVLLLTKDNEIKQ